MVLKGSFTSITFTIIDEQSVAVTCLDSENTASSFVLSDINPDSVSVGQGTETVLVATTAKGQSVIFILHPVRKW
jgi:hypothetical protein